MNARKPAEARDGGGGVSASIARCPECDGVISLRFPIHDCHPARALTGKWEILAKDHPTVVRRLCRELNHRPAGFYVNGERYNQARVMHGQLYTRMGGDPWIPQSPCNVFDDGSGGTIEASRTKCGH